MSRCKLLARMTALALSILANGSREWAAECKWPAREIADKLRSAINSEVFEGFNAVIECRALDQLKLVETQVYNPEEPVAAAAAMTLAIIKEPSARVELMSRYMACPNGDGCTMEPVHLLAAVIEACSPRSHL